MQVGRLSWVYSSIVYIKYIQVQCPAPSKGSSGWKPPHYIRGSDILFIKMSEDPGQRHVEREKKLSDTHTQRNQRKTQILTMVNVLTIDLATIN